MLTIQPMYAIQECKNRWYKQSCNVYTGILYQTICLKHMLNTMPMRGPQCNISQSHGINSMTFTGLYTHLLLQLSSS